MPILPKYRNQFTNKGEKEIFHHAIESKYFETSSRFLFHSLRNHNARNKIVGEVDFVYLDDQFIIFLESKGGGVKYESETDQWWVLGGTQKGDPFRQVTNYLFYLRDNIFPKYFPHNNYEKRLIFGYGIMFPDAEKKLSFVRHNKKSFDFENETIEYDPQIIYTASDHESSDGFVKYLEHLKHYWRNHGKYAHRRNSYGIGIKGLDDVRKLFRKDLIFEVPMSNIIDGEHANIQQFTEEQFSILDTFDLIKGRGLVVIGGPGTGKTVLAKEFLVRQNLENKTCAYFCFNKNLAGEVNRFIKHINLDNNIKCFYVHGYMYEALKKMKLLPDNTKETNEFWNSILPLQFKLWHTSLKIEQFDFIILDEAQDVFTENLIDSVFLSLKGGVESGSWASFVDYHYQKFYNGFDEEYYKLFLNTYPSNVQILPVNCRNHINIIEIASLHSGLALMPCRREKVPFRTKTIFFNNSIEFIEGASLQINAWAEEKIKPEQITILAFDNEKIKNLRKNLKFNLHQVTEEVHKKEGFISISTIHSYKGLENDFIIIAGIDHYDRHNKEQMSLLFVGYSRAMIGLTILINNMTKPSLALAVLSN